MTLRYCMEQRDFAAFVSGIEDMTRETDAYCFLPRESQYELYFNVWICTEEEFRWFETCDSLLFTLHSKLQALLKHYDETMAEYTDADTIGFRGYMLYVMPSNYEWMAYEYAERLGSRLMKNACAQAPENPIWRYFCSNDTAERNRLSPAVQAELQRKFKGGPELLQYFLEMTKIENELL